jgi:hypothetical protein
VKRTLYCSVNEYANETTPGHPHTSSMAAKTLQPDFRTAVSGIVVRSGFPIEKVRCLLIMKAFSTLRPTRDVPTNRSPLTVRTFYATTGLTVSDCA